MIQEFAYIREIESRLCGGWGFTREGALDDHTPVWRDLVEGDFKAVIARKLAEYRNTLSAMQSFDLHALNGVRAKELLAHFQRAHGVRSNLSRPGGCSTAEIRFIQAFYTLAIGYIAATAWEYIRPGRNIDANKFLAPFLSAGLSIKEVAQSAEQQGITDADTFLQFISCPAGQDATGQPKPTPKDAILNNQKAIAKLKILVDNGFCDNNYGWIKEGHTNFQRATAAYLIGIRAGIDGYYFAFEDLWQCKYLSSDKKKATELRTPKAKGKIDTIYKLLDN